ncbi:MAG: hypothetical protein WKF75_06320 [Singulisphaera sp.]
MRRQFQYPRPNYSVCPQYGGFMLGNVRSTVPVGRRRASSGDRGRRRRGRRPCRRTCSYFDFCGGAPVNKYFENGSFVSSETMFCPEQQAVFDVVLEKMERVVMPA